MPLRPESPSLETVVTLAEISDLKNAAYFQWHSRGQGDSPTDI